MARAFIHVDCWGTLRISSRWWICLPIDWFSPRRQISGRAGRNFFCQSGKFDLWWFRKLFEVFPIFNLGATQRFHGHAYGFLRELPKNVFEDFSRIFLGLCVFAEFTDASREKLWFPHSFPYSRVVEGRWRLPRCVWFEGNFLINMISFTSEALTFCVGVGSSYTTFWLLGGVGLVDQFCWTIFCK